MRLKAVTGIVLTVLVIGMLALAFDIQPVKASGTIYIRADGSIDPPTANTTSADHVTYYLTDNNYDVIVIERRIITVDGNGYTLQGPGYEPYDPVTYGFYLDWENNVTIQNTNIKDFFGGVYIHSIGIPNYNTVCGNNITNNYVGVSLRESCSNTICGNTITNSPYVGVDLLSCEYNTICGNTITNFDGGIEFDRSSFNTISGNNIEDGDSGIFFADGSNYNTISGNNIENNYQDGIEFSSSSRNTISENNIQNTYWIGISLHDSSNNNTFSANNITATDVLGIMIQDSSNYNTFSGNNIENNGHTFPDWGYGVGLYSSANNKFYHNNFIDNNPQVYINQSGYPNVWDDGYPSGGNYLDDYTGIDWYSGPYQNETGSDGIGDTPYVIDGDNTDNYPLMSPWLGNVTIKAHCNTEDVDVSVSIDMDGSPTGYTTPHTFENLTGTHNFTVPDTDPIEHPFKQWSTDETSTTITVTAGGTYTAYYQAKYNLTITTTTGGTTNPSPGTHTYWDGTVVSVTAVPDTGYDLDHWELDSSWNYSNPITVIMDSNHTLHAVFTYNVTIRAFCITELTSVGVSITMDGSPTGYDTPHTFTNLTDTHNFTVPDSDPNEHSFWQWSTGEASTTITVTTRRRHTAYYGKVIGGGAGGGGAVSAMHHLFLCL